MGVGSGNRRTRPRRGHSDSTTTHQLSLPAPEDPSTRNSALGGPKRLVRRTGDSGCRSHLAEPVVSIGCVNGDFAVAGKHCRRATA